MTRHEFENKICAEGFRATKNNDFPKDLKSPTEFAKLTSNEHGRHEWWVTHSDGASFYYRGFHSTDLCEGESVIFSYSQEAAQ